MNYPPPPPAEPVALMTIRRLKRPYICGVLALLMAVGLIASVFWPWLTSALPGGEDVSGWDIYQRAGDTGENAFVVTEAFGEGFSPLFTGLTVTIAGGVLGAAALVLMASPKVKQPSQLGIPKVPATLIALLGVAVLLVSGVSLLSLVLTQPRPYLIQPGVGLITGVLFAAVGGMALVIGGTGSSGRKRSVGH